MIFKCIEKSTESHVTMKLLKQAPSVNTGDGTVMFKQIIVNIFVTAIHATFSTKTKLFTLDPNNFKFKWNTASFHEDVCK